MKTLSITLCNFHLSFKLIYIILIIPATCDTNDGLHFPDPRQGKPLIFFFFNTQIVNCMFSKKMYFLYVFLIFYESKPSAICIPLYLTEAGYNANRIENTIVTFCKVY